LNEKFSPELLPHHAEIVDCMMEQLSVMQQNIDRARKADLKVSIHKMEVSFLIAFYLSSANTTTSTFSFHFTWFFGFTAGWTSLLLFIYVIKIIRNTLQ